MKLNKTKVRYIIRQNRKRVATEEIARDVKVSQRRVQQIIKEYKETRQEPVLGEKVGRPRKPFVEKEAEVIRAAHARYRYGARMRMDCTPDNGQIVKQWYLRQPPFRTELEICNRKLNVASFGCTPFR
jgi:hypothetical protein